MIYLDNAATTFPKPQKVISEMSHCMKYFCANPGRSGHDMASKMASKIYDTRESLADFFNISDPLRIVFTSNATESLNLAIKGFLNPGDHVITTAMENNSVLRPLKEMRDIAVTIIPADKCGRISTIDVEAAICPRTRLIICTHSSNVCGTILPIKSIGAICKKHRIRFLVDASQSAGILPIDVEENGIDMLACPGHKSLFGPQGTGFLYVGQGIRLKPLKEGGTGTDSANLHQPLYFPEGYESGTLNGPGIIGLGEGIKFINKITLSTISQWENHICAILTESLCNMNNVTVYGPFSCEEKTAIVAFNINNVDCEETAYRLNKDFGIAVRSGYHCAPLAHKTLGTFGIGSVRMSLSIFNTKEDVSKAVNAIYSLST